MRYAIFSDLHANSQAWAAVRDDISHQGVDALVCLGDVVGYGPRPQEVLESVYELTQNFVLGNHDAVIGGRLDPEIFNDHAREVIEWTREHLNEDARQFFAEVPFTIEGAGFLAVHAEAAQPGRFSYIVEAEDARQSFDATTEQIIFVGHTHHPGRFELRGRQIHKYGSEDFRVEDGKRYVVNTGSVGEPRTPDIHASYCIYDSFQKKIIFRKLPFDIEGFKRDLEEVGLPIRPYFLDVYESGGATVAHEPAELAMKRTPKIPVGAVHSGHARRVVVIRQDEEQLTRRFGSAVEAYKAVEAGSGAALWIILSLAVALMVVVGVYALNGGNKNEGSWVGSPGEIGSDGGRVGNPVVLVHPDAPEPPDEVVWHNLVVSGYRNLAKGAHISSDEFPQEEGSKGELAVNDGDPDTYLQKVGAKGNYLIALRFNEPTRVSALSLSGLSHHDHAAEDFDVYADGSKIKSVRGASYLKNQLLVPLPMVIASELELRISKSYHGTPVIREIGVYDWDLEQEKPSVAAVGSGVKPGDGDPVGTGGGEVTQAVSSVAETIEGEDLKASRPPSGKVWIHGMGEFRDGSWSGDAHLIWTGGKKDESIDLEFTVDEGGGQELFVVLTKAGDYGIVQLSLNGEEVGEPIDCYDEKVTTTGEISLGKHDLDTGKHTLRATLVGSNPNTRDTAKVGTYVFAIDLLRMEQAEPAKAF